MPSTVHLFIKVSVMFYYLLSFMHMELVLIGQYDIHLMLNLKAQFEISMIHMEPVICVYLAHYWPLGLNFFLIN